MERATFAGILGRIPETTHSKDAHSFADGHRVTVYVGQPGRAMVIADLASCTLEKDLAILVAREPETTYYVGYEDVHALVHRPPEPKSERRAGFS